MPCQVIRKFLLVFCFVVVAGCLFPGVMNDHAFAADNGSAAFSWQPNSEADLAGYRIYYGTTRGGPYGRVFEVGNPAPVDGRIHASVTGLSEGETYFFVCVAYNEANQESDYSVEAEYRVPLPSSSPDTTPPAPPSGLGVR